MSKFLTVGDLLGQLKDVPKDYEILVSSDCSWNNCIKEIKVVDEDREVNIYDYC